DGSALPPLHYAVVDIHPIVLLPGNGCSKFDAELTKHYKPSPAPQGRGRDGGSDCGRTALCSSALPPLHDATIDLHPIVLLPGNGCSQLDAELTEHYEPSPWAPASCGGAAAAGKGKGRRRWFRLWKNNTTLGDPAVAPCYADQLRVVYDRAVADYRNVDGVRTRVVSFGTTRGFGADDDPSDPER
uniref:Lecithin-cholesterol acyltransferase n=1 Tax=Oryza meridionalis TaxID=40149 RepID=A0A0E0EW43_9ORYZ